MIELMRAALGLALAGAAAGQITNQDDCAGATNDVVGPGAYAVNTSAATTGQEGQNEPLCNGFGGIGIEHDIWFVFQPTTTGTVELFACGFGPTQGGKVAMYPGTSCPANGTALACDGESCFAQGGGAYFASPVVAGASYLVQVGAAPGQPPYVGTLIISEQPGVAYCTNATPNSTGQPAIVTALGSGRVADDDLTLLATWLPPGEFGYFLVSATQGSVQPPNSVGTLCLAGAIGRFNAPGEVFTGPSAELELDLGALPLSPPTAVLPGDTWNFQAWYRDVGGANNFSTARSITFQ